MTTTRRAGRRPGSGRPGHRIFRVADAGRQRAVLGLRSTFAFDAPATRATRRRMQDAVATDRVQVVRDHFRFPAAAHIVPDGVGHRHGRAVRS